MSIIIISQKSWTSPIKYVIINIINSKKKIFKNFIFKTQIMATIKERMDSYNIDLEELNKKHSFKLGSEASIADGKIVTRVVLIDVKKQDAKEE